MLWEINTLHTALICQQPYLLFFEMSPASSRGKRNTPPTFSTSLRLRGNLAFGCCLHGDGKVRLYLARLSCESPRRSISLKLSPCSALPRPPASQSQRSGDIKSLSRRINASRSWNQKHSSRPGATLTFKLSSGRKQGSHSGQ